MRRTVAIFSLLLVLVPQTANAKEIKYIKQKDGQFCAVKEINNSVTLPSGKKLICTKEGSRARWKNS